MKSKSVYQKELEFIQKAVSIKEKSQKNIVSSPTTIDILTILEDFLRKHKFLCYGGIAINNILPPTKQFYDKNTELPDYDFFSTDAMTFSQKLADLYYKKGYENVEAKSGLHEGTYKVYVNFLQIADITQLDPVFYKSLEKKSIVIDGIHYCPPNFLRMSIYLELSRPDGDVSRWEKIYNRLQLLNKYHPIKHSCKKQQTKLDKKIYESIQKQLNKYGVLFFGGYAMNVYGKYNKQLKGFYELDVFANNLSEISYLLKQSIPSIKLTRKKSIAKLIPEHIVVQYDDIVYATIYKTDACYSYNYITLNGHKSKIATLYTILSMYLTFIYAKRFYYDEDKLLCLSEQLIRLYKQTRLKNKGIFKNYSISCYGDQLTFEKIIMNRNLIYEKFKNKKNSKEYKRYFLRYVPSDEKKKETKKTKKKTKPKSKKKETQLTKIKLMEGII